jgi:iron complex outermembrane recepter protein
MKTARTALYLLFLLIPATAVAQNGATPFDVTTLTLEDLLNVRITSVGRKEQSMLETAAAVAVLTSDDIQRSGVRTVAELLRLVPGVHVARANASAWAIGVRGFSDVYSDKLLVLIDGRSVYNRNFSGVFWDMEDMLVDDIDHIEVIRGAGGAEWGANAVSGVINIITKSSADTRGALVRVGAGTFDPMQASVRYGGSLGGATFRLSSQWSGHGASQLSSGAAAGDSWAAISNTSRVDWARGGNALVLHGGFTASRPRPLWMQLTGPTGTSAASSVASDRTNTSAMARWTHQDDAGGSLRIQSSFTRLYMAEVSTTEAERIADVDGQYRRPIGRRHDVIYGGGYRLTGTDLSKPTFSYSVAPARSRVGVLNVFAQDEIRIVDAVKATIGTKVERESLSGWSLQPTARAVWTVTPAHYVWGSVSRAVRTPSGSDRGIDLQFAAFTGGNGEPVVLGTVGNPDLRSETVLDRQVGYRFRAGTNVAVDVSAFRAGYSRLQTSEPRAPVRRTFEGIEYTFSASRYDNLLEATTSGVEVSGDWAVTPAWLLKGSYSGFGISTRISPFSLDTNAGTRLRTTPSHQWQARSTAQVGPRAEVTLGLAHVGGVAALNAPAYTRADANLQIKASRQLFVIVGGRNLLDGAHPEFPSWSTGMLTTSIPRSGSVQLVWRP